MNTTVIKKTLMGMGIILGVLSGSFLVLSLLVYFPIYSMPALAGILVGVGGYKIGQLL